MKDPYKVLIRRLHTEKTTLLSSLKDLKSNKSIRRFLCPKACFVVYPGTTRTEIAKAVELAYADKSVKVLKVNTINVKNKPVRFRGRKGFKKSFRKAIITFSKDSDIGLI